MEKWSKSWRNGAVIDVHRKSSGLKRCRVDHIIMLTTNSHLNLLLDPFVCCQFTTLKDAGHAWNLFGVNLFTIYLTLFRHTKSY